MVCRATAGHRECAPTRRVRKRLIERLADEDPRPSSMNFSTALASLKARVIFYAALAASTRFAAGATSTSTPFSLSDAQRLSPAGRYGAVLPSWYRDRRHNEVLFPGRGGDSLHLLVCSISRTEKASFQQWIGNKFCLFTRRWNADTVRKRPQILSFLLIAVEDLDDAERRFTLSCR